MENLIGRSQAQILSTIDMHYLNESLYFSEPQFPYIPTLANIGDHGQSAGALGHADSAHDELGMLRKPQMPSQQLQTRGNNGADSGGHRGIELMVVVTGGHVQDLLAPNSAMQSTAHGPAALASSGAY